MSEFPTKPSDADVAMMLDAVARASDPLQRFIDQLSDDEPFRARHFAEETVRLRREFEGHASAMLTARDVRESLRHAEWLRQNAHDVAYRWTSLVKAAVRWSEISAESMAFRVGKAR